jgi:hypothetical protein
MIAAKRPLIEPPITSARRVFVIGNSYDFSIFPQSKR